MYDAHRLDTGPSVRIGMLRAALARRTDLETIAGPRLTRALAAMRWLVTRRGGAVDAVYVEAASSFATPIDLAFLGLMRLKGAPVGVYFRDAYQLFRHQYPVSRFRHRFLDWFWRLSTPLLKRIATRRFAPSAGLAEALGLRDAVLMPPGTDPRAPFLGTCPGSTVAYVGEIGAADGLELLVEAMRQVRRRCPQADLIVVSAHDPRPRFGMPPWLRHVPVDRAALGQVLASARLCVIPRPITRYTDLAVPIKLMDYLSFGKPVVATDCFETARVVQASGGGLTVADRPEALADAIVRVIEDDDLARRLATAARQYAVAHEQTWDARAERILLELRRDRSRRV